MKTGPAIKVRPITAEESKILDQWQRSDNVISYRRARMLRLSEKGREYADIAEVLGLHVDIVRHTIKAFNASGIGAITPEPGSRSNQLDALSGRDR